MRTSEASRLPPSSQRPICTSRGTYTTPTTPRFPLYLNARTSFRRTSGTHTHSSHREETQEENSLASHHSRRDRETSLVQSWASRNPSFLVSHINRRSHTEELQKQDQKEPCPRTLYSGRTRTTLFLSHHLLARKSW